MHVYVLYSKLQPQLAISHCKTITVAKPVQLSSINESMVLNGENVTVKHFQNIHNRTSLK